MNKYHEKHGIIFDLDGTLWDSSEQVGIAWNTVFKNSRYDIEVTHEMMAIMMGRTIPEIGELAFPFIPVEERTELLKDCCREENRRLNLYGGKPFPKVPETLEALSQSYPLFIVSNCEDGYIESFLNYHKAWPFIKDIECIGRTGLAKGGNIKLICERNGLEKAVYIGDTERDMRSAEQAGVPFVFAAYGFGNAPEAEYAVNCFDELPSIIQKIFGEEAE